jgi:hypothetical protein
MEEELRENNSSGSAQYIHRTTAREPECNQCIVCA